MKFWKVFVFLLIFDLGFSQNGKILTKTKIDLSQSPIWEHISNQGSLIQAYEYLNDLDFYYIIYESDGLEVEGFYVEPKQEVKYPVIIFNRGGNRDFAPLSLGTLIKYTSKLALAGYVVIGSNYRKEDQFGGDDINDVLNLTETLKEIDKAQADNIGMFGWSRGGMMTYLALQKSSKFKTAVVGNAPTDLFALIQDRPVMETKVFAECIPNYWNNKEEVLKKRSVVYWADELNKDSSLLILCGTKDKRVNPQQADKIADKLQALHYDFKLMKFDTNHFFTGKKEELNQTLIDWFDAHLKNKKD